MKKSTKKKTKGTGSLTHSHPTAQPLKRIITEVEKLDCESMNILKKQLLKKGHSPTVRIWQTKPLTLHDVHTRLQRDGLTSTLVVTVISITMKTTTESDGKGQSKTRQENEKP